jgi:hypothetical protein
MRHGRKRPYTEVGVRRLPCAFAGCPNRAEHQWQVCADGNLFRPVCLEHDYELNRVALEAMGGPDVPAKLRAYRARLGI